MLAAMIVLLATTAFVQFGLYYWRAVVAGMGKHPLSNELLTAAGLGQARVTGGDFWTLSGLNRVTPALRRQAGGLRLVRTYFQFVELLWASLGQLVPGVGAWSQREMATCACYAAVLVDRKMKSNLDCMAALRSC
jgi:hypothetical protein